MVEPLDRRPVLLRARSSTVEDAGVQPVYQHPRRHRRRTTFVSDGFISHNTECRLAPLAMEMVRDIDEDTVDFSPNYDGRQKQPTCCRRGSRTCWSTARAASRSAWRRTSRRTTCARSRPACSGSSSTRTRPTRSCSPRSSERIHGPDFPTKGLIVGRTGIEEAYRTGRGSVTMRAVVEVEEDSRGRTCLVISELPYQVNPDALARKIAELADRARSPASPTCATTRRSRTGMRIVVVLKRDAVASVVRNNLYKHTQLQDTFGCNMVALVDGIPRTLSLDAFVRHWVNHQIEVIQRRTRYRLRKAEERAHILRGLVKALDVLDEVIALIRRSPAVEDARAGLIELLEVDELQANAILGHAAAPARRARAAEDRRRARRSSRDRRVRGDPRQRARSARSSARSSPRSSSGSATSAARRLDRVRRRPHRRGLDPARGRRRHDHHRRLRQAHPRRPLPRAEARRQGRARRAAAPGRHRRPLLRHVDPRLVAVLHEPGPGLPRQGVRAARGRPRRARPARGEPARVRRRREDRPGRSTSDYEAAPYLVLATSSAG